MTRFAFKLRANLWCPLCRVKVTENGDLVVRHVLPSDEGKYQCVAHNMAGTRESPIVPLSVHGEYNNPLPPPSLSPPLVGQWGRTDSHCLIGLLACLLIT